MQQAREILRDAAAKAASTIVALMDKPGRNAKVQLDAARDILDRSLGKASADFQFNVPISGGSVTLNIVAVPALSGAQAPSSALRGILPAQQDGGPDSEPA